MALQYLLMSLLFAFVYWWFIHEERLERFAYLFWYVVIGLMAAFIDFHDAKLILAALLMMMIVQWYLGFKWGIGVINDG